MKEQRGVPELSRSKRFAKTGRSRKLLYLVTVLPSRVEGCTHVTVHCDHASGTRKSMLRR